MFPCLSHGAISGSACVKLPHKRNLLIQFFGVSKLPPAEREQTELADDPIPADHGGNTGVVAGFGAQQTLKYFR